MVYASFADQFSTKATNKNLTFLDHWTPDSTLDLELVYKLQVTGKPLIRQDIDKKEGVGSRTSQNSCLRSFCLLKGKSKTPSGFRKGKGR
jgi:hypothetical protein